MDRDLELLIWRRAGSICEYCHMAQAFDELPFEIEHVIAVSHDGRTIASNLALSCFPCNRFKGTNLAGLDPATGRLTKLFHPRRHTWSRHVRVLRINSTLRCRLRAQLVAEGVLELLPAQKSRE